MLSLQNVSLFNGSTALLENCTLNLDGSSGKKIAVVGKNGCGKSTLLRVLRGEIAPDRGKVISNNETIGYLPQDIHFPRQFSLVGEYLESRLEESWQQYKIDIALQEFNLPEEFLIKEIAYLSGGEKVKVALLALLLTDPTILLFDEPTNNLDATSIAWLEAFMSSFQGTIVFVSHDRALINAVSNSIWEFDHDDHVLRTYGGNFEYFWQERAHRIERQRQQHEAQYKQIAALEKWLVANEFHPKYRYSDLVLSQKQALENLRKNLVPKPEPEPRILLKQQSDSNKGLLFKLTVSKKSLPERDILQNVSLSLHHNEKVLITGANGTGKTTLLNIIAGADTDFVGSLETKSQLKIGYLRQFNHFPANVTLLETFLRETYTNESEARSILANFLFPSEFMSSKLQSLSQGELRRLNLAIILTNKPDLLLLDEPTNHLDIFSKETLEHFIIQSHLPMIIVSHDRYFIERIAVTSTYTIA